MKKIQKQKTWIFLLLIVALLLNGCSGLQAVRESNKKEISEETASSTEQKVSKEDYGEYSDEPYQELNQNEPEFSSKEKKSTEAFESYSELDSLGRCGTAYANICKELMPEEKRGAIGMIKPSGWHTVKYSNIDGKYLYNRCHLIGYQLAGENANEKNLITGTRYFNVEGMLPFENEVAEYVEDTGNHVLYRVTPVYEGEDLVAKGVQMEGYSVEDKGEGICFNVFVYNAQPGIAIDYSNGDSKKEVKQNTVEKKKSSGQQTTEEKKSSEQQKKKYVMNKNTRKFHLPSCSSVSDTLAKNRKEFQGDREELIEAGYDPCKRCNP